MKTIINTTNLMIATAADAPIIARLVNSAYRAENSSAGWTSEVGILAGSRANPTMVSEFVESETTSVLLLRDLSTDELIGCVAVEPVDERTWFLSMLSIGPRHQAKGYGRLLLTAAEEYIRDRGAAQVRMTVIQVRTDLIAWYQRRGYRLTGELEAFPYGDESVGIPLRSDLHFVVLEKGLGNPV